MKNSDIDKAIEVVGSERALHAMLLEVVKAWGPDFLEGFSEHTESGGSVYDFFLDREECSSAPESPFYMDVKRHGAGYMMTIGICFDGTCGEGADFEFTNSFDLIGNGPCSQWIH